MGNTDVHHDFIDETRAVIYDVAWDAVQVSKLDVLDGFDVKECEVVMRGPRERQSTKED